MSFTSVLVGTALTEALGSPQPVDSYVMTSGRLWSLVGMAAGLAGAAIGGLTLARPRIGKRGAVAALVSGLVGGVLGALVVSAAEGGPGTGYGIVGGYLAVVVGLISVATGGLALARVRRTT